MRKKDFTSSKKRIVDDKLLNAITARMEKEALRNPGKGAKIPWIISYCGMVLGAHNPRLVLGEMAREVRRFSDELQWVEDRMAQPAARELIIKDDLFQLIEAATDRVYRGRDDMKKLNWKSRYYIEIYPEYLNYLPALSRWAKDVLKEASQSYTHDGESKEKRQSIKKETRKRMVPKKRAAA